MDQLYASVNVLHPLVAQPWIHDTITDLSYGNVNILLVSMICKRTMGISANIALHVFVV